MVDTNSDGKRYFFGPEDDIKYCIATPTAEDVRGADWQYSKTFTRCLVEGITTSAEMMDILNRRGIIGPEFEQRAKELANNLYAKISELNKTTDMDTKRELSYAVAQAREELFQWNQRLNGPMNNTAEQISDDTRLEYLTSCMTTLENGNRVWNSYNDYLKEKNQPLALRARFEVMIYLKGLDSDFLEQTPEAVAMREVESELLVRAEAIMTAANAVKEETLDLVEFPSDADDIEQQVTEEAVEDSVKKTEKKPKSKK